MKPLFSVVLIARNEEEKLPHLLSSLTEFKARGGEVLLLDTGSTDKTAQVARDWGCRVEEVGDKFLRVIDNADEINKHFIVEGEAPVVKNGDKLFDFAGARNYIADFATTKMIAVPDCDEMYTKLNIDKINEHIEKGATQLEYNFVFSHDQFGNEAIKFMHCKFYDRTILKWQGIVHEILVGSATRVFLDENIIKLEHWQNEKTNRGGYLKGLALDCYLNPDNDRNSHYFAREMLWNGRPASGIKEFERHIAMNKWPAERAQSMIHIGTAYGQLNQPDKQAEWYSQAFYNDSSRREPLIQLSRFFSQNNNHLASLAYARASLEIPWHPYYGNDMKHYTVTPHELMYRAYGWLGNIPQAQQEILICLGMEPLNMEYLRDFRFYFDLPTISVIIPTLNREEGLKRCLTSVKIQNYPQDKIDIKVLSGEEGTVITKVQRGVVETKGEFIVYGADDVEFEVNAFILAIQDYMREKKGLIAFDTGVRNTEGFINEHFMIKRDFIPQVGGVIFDLDFHHVGVDDLLWKRANKIGQAMISRGKARHKHFSRIGSGVEQDSTIKKGWAKESEDRALLAKKLKEEDL